MLGGENRRINFLLKPKIRTDTGRYKALRPEYKHCLLKPSLKGLELSGKVEKNVENAVRGDLLWSRAENLALSSGKQPLNPPRKKKFP